MTARTIIPEGAKAMKHTRYVNFYPPCDADEHTTHPWRTTSWVTRALADRNARRGRLACVCIEFEDGDGLSNADQRTMADG